MCSSTLFVNCEKVEKDTQRYPDCRSPISQRSHVGNLRQTLQGKGVIHKRVETAGCPSFLPTAVGTASPPAEVQ